MALETKMDGSTILVTGGTGSWGHELITQLLEKTNPKEIRIYSRGEHKQVQMRHDFQNNPKLKFIIGDIRDKNVLGFAMRGVDYVFHLAALKHVPVCEENSWEAVLTNIYGAQNVIECAIENKVKKVIDISTDKAVDPFNFYGVTKAAAEKMIVNANHQYNSGTKFMCIRGGNVMGTNGSVLPLFRDQIKKYNEITVTDPEMTRYLMSTKQAIGLVFEAVTHSVGGEIFVMRMPATKVDNIANVMIKLFGNAQTRRKTIGVRPGEKLCEVLVSKNESKFARIWSDEYFVILPQISTPELENAYSSLPRLPYDEFNSDNALKLDDEQFIEILKNESWLWIE